MNSMEQIVERCIDCGLEKTETNSVEPRWPGYGYKMYMRCESCGDKRLEREEEAKRKYPKFQPADFDPDYAGERWDEDH